MLFNSLQFLIFFPIVLCVFYVIPEKLKRPWLLIASYFFYMCWNARYALLLLTSTAVTFASGILIERAREKDPPRMKPVVAASFVINLSILFFFKYFNFTVNLLQNIAALFHITLNAPVLDVILPVGISFYTFQALSYTVDVYRRDVEAEKSFVTYALYVSFFPQLVAGPIERSKNLLQQLKVFKKFDYRRFLDGSMIMLWGYFLKVVLADRISVFVDTVYRDIPTYGGMYLIVATILFAIQIYCDFAGYSTIAVGAAKILGINIMENFKAPYLSTSVGMFWRNWHISLTSWFKDYLYIPLGGSRKGKGRKYMNKLIVFLVSGLWHGADLSFVVWGGLNGIYQIIGEVLLPFRTKVNSTFNLSRDTIGHKAMEALITFILVDFAWIFFRAQSISDAVMVIKSIFTTYNPWILFDGSLYNCGLNSKEFWFMITCILILLWSDVQKKKNVIIRDVILAQDGWCKVLIIAVAISAILIFGVWGTGYNDSSFIYFQF
ncbi:MAG: MBOAT family protein [Butyrivibrio sp.]|nr:MBOAT family protein [Butyrivibrio sp.]